MTRAGSEHARLTGGFVQEKRSHDRYSIQLPVVLLHGGNEYPGETRDLSLGGMFVHMRSPLPFGSDVTLKLALPESKYEGELPMIVRWTRGEGVGLAFKSLRARDVHALNGLFKKYL
jgi:hypothetical protein